MNFYENISKALLKYNLISERNKSFYTDVLKLVFSFFTGFLIWISLRKIPAFEIFFNSTPIPALMTTNLLLIVHQILSVLGFQSDIQNNIIFVQYAVKPIRVIYGCLALSQMGLIAGLVISYPGNFLHKCWFIPISLIIIHLLNAFRIIGLAVVLIYFPQFGELTHFYLTRIAIYFGILLLWFCWIKYFSKKKSLKSI